MNSETLNPIELSLKKHLAQQSQMPAFESYLLKKILSRLEYETQLKQLKPRLWVSLGLLLAGLGLLFAAADVSWHAFLQTSFPHFFGLIFTDFGVVLANWKEFSFSLLDNLPLGSTAFFLTSCLATVVVFDFSARQLSSFRKLLNHQHYGSK